MSESGRSFFYKDTYPNDELVRDGAHVINDDTIIVSKKKDGKSYALFLGDKSEHVGWVDSKDIKEIPTTIAVDWAGSYKDSSNLKKIKVKMLDNKLLQITE
ncbi:hypothetical protein D6R50_21015 [Aeromonas veronii]|uniref:Uncharacterized protein n=2 Tax=Aeromonas veronii TaxID=654 RepID=A0A3A9ISD2_AERVE|nr:hypothetical protein D6R50_21015 [Aeromonas veronii]